MRNVYCKVDDVSEAKTCCKALYTKFVKLGLNPEIDVAGIPEIKCKGYDIKFLEERQWLSFTTTKAGTGYLTIPYNRILISPHGVPQADCKLSRLIELVKQGF